YKRRFQWLKQKEFC
uniref:Uncharacterized protein n=1 Tax=Panagrolaimus sp. PS1159 TaxID=55785 RepID=A0AC35GN38_9BILA